MNHPMKTRKASPKKCATAATKKPPVAKRVPLPPHLQELEDELKGKKKAKLTKIPKDVKELEKLFASVSSSTRRKRWASTLLNCLSTEENFLASLGILISVLVDKRIENGITRGGSLASLWAQKSNASFW